MPRIRILVGSETGTAEEVALAMSDWLLQRGWDPILSSQTRVEDLFARDFDALLICCATTGAGDQPMNVAQLYHETLERFPLLDGCFFGVVALGDRSFGDTFCGAGLEWDRLLEELLGHRLQALLQLDASSYEEPVPQALVWLEGWHQSWMAQGGNEQPVAKVVNGPIGASKT